MKLEADVLVSSEAFDPPARDIVNVLGTVVFAAGPDCDGGGTEMNPEEERDEFERYSREMSRRRCTSSVSAVRGYPAWRWTQLTTPGVFAPFPDELTPA
jgi:hypothetical protein